MPRPVRSRRRPAQAHSTPPFREVPIPAASPCSACAGREDCQMERPWTYDPPRFVTELKDYERFLSRSFTRLRARCRGARVEGTLATCKENQFVLGCIVSHALRDALPVAHHEDPIRDGQKFFELG